MPREYVLKKPVIDTNRLKKLAKTCIEDGTADRKLALDTLEYFKEIVKHNSKDDTAKKCMTDCMKLAQSAKINLTKIIELIIKIEDLEHRKSISKPIARDTDSTTTNFFSEQFRNEKKF